MARINALSPDATTGKSKEMFDAIQGKLGMVPNMMRTMGNSPAVLNGYLSLSGALNESSIGGKLNELIALTVANANGCDYCNAAHTYIGEKLVGIDVVSIDAARFGQSKDAKIEAALIFAKEVVATRGQVASSDIEDVKAAGYDDAQVAEIVAAVALNIFTNYFNNVAETVVDFPKVTLVNQI
ncbi:carboxymuconolactone decarboxylase family protein [Flavobacterium soyangense]|uniref:Carboxymuconolactone decarboxylase family protein n=1 Tax=Flavobacterium soyangense TaxID=2023265 RepID=A0A930U700_9FLAO|nr:carboxymuconolactone decarboxylase family protein [Flavobacterium soyangense]MBF2708058.1 carboxymuconolactone decarboxylase family protein [Flavobacterium soyangense]